MQIKVAHIITMLELGGAQKNTLYTVAHLDKNRFETILITGPGGLLDTQAKELEQSGVQVFFINNMVRPVRPFKDLLALFSILRCLNKYKPDIVHTHSSKAGIIGRVASRLAGVPVIVHTYHGFGFNSRQKSLTRWFFIMLERLTAHLTDCLIVVSEANHRTALSFGIGEPEKYVLIRSGIDLKRINDTVAMPRNELRRRLGFLDEMFYVVTVCPFKPQKNLADFIKLAALVSEKKKNIRFMVIGDGEQRPELESLVRQKKLGNTISLLGWRDNAVEFLAAGDAFVLTSLWEGLPRALAEAMSAGTVPLVYSVDGVTDLVKNGENGFAFAPGDIYGMAEKLRELLENNEVRARFSGKALKSVGREFDIDFMVDKMTELYFSLLKKLK